MDLVIPYKLNSSDELRYMLRTVEAHLQVEQVWLIGDRPGWIQNVNHIPHRQMGSMYLNGANILYNACLHPDISDDFIYTNDDIFILKTPKTLYYNRGTYEKVLETVYRTTHRRRMRMTYEFLEGVYKKPINYELHIPMIINKQKYLEATKYIKDMYKYNKRSIYGNYVNYGGKVIKDVKVPSVDKHATSKTFVSTSELSFSDGRVGAMIKNKYYLKSKYEK